LGARHPENIFNFSSSEVAFEPVLANSIASTTPPNRGTTALLLFADGILCGGLEIARLARMIANRQGY